MCLLKILGSILMLIALVCLVIVYLVTFGALKSDKVVDNAGICVIIFLFSAIGGGALIAHGSDDEGFFAFIGGIALIIVGIISIILVFADFIEIISIKDTLNLWGLFAFCTIFGILFILNADNF